MRFKTAAGAAICAATVIGFGGSAFAGEVTGSGKGGPGGDGRTGMIDRASSICAYSGLEDGLAIIGFGPLGPIFLVVEGGPGEVQTPHHETAADIIHEPGVAGQACRGNGG